MRRLVSLSGGMDSVTVLAEALQGCNDVRAVGFCYGSKHNRYENDAAFAVAKFYGVPYELIDLTMIGKQLKSNLLKTGDDVPEGHYQQSNMSQTVVPGRNLIFISILAAIAQSWKIDEVWLGIHSGDHVIYPDCRPEFFAAANAAVYTASEGLVTLQAPFLTGDKTTIIQRGLELGVPYRLTRTCYKDQEVACGKCGSCQERLEAFRNNGIADPIAYESRELLAKPV